MRHPVGAHDVHAFFRGLARRAREPARVYLTGGASAVLLGWREATIDLDVCFHPDRGELFSALPELKETLRVNVELASPPDFVPALPGWEDRSIFVESSGPLELFHFDFYSQALSKIERSHEQDREDVYRVLGDGLVDPARLRELFAAVEDRFDRYPAVDLPSLRRALDEALAPFE